MNKTKLRKIVKTANKLEDLIDLLSKENIGEDQKVISAAHNLADLLVDYLAKHRFSKYDL